ncbi:MAG: hypothetical protein HYW49_08715 [Deltaproteobacteria bacterium]|nr:hypothetical protein [Deltaproteobacteria bacterium]
MTEDDERRRAERILGLGKMSLTTVHDVNNQLTVLSMHADSLLERFEGDGAASEVREELQQITSGIGRIVALLAHFPRFANAGEKAVGPLDLNECAEQVCRYLLKTLGTGKTKAKLTKVLAPEALYVKADQVDVFNALVERASGVTGSISIRTYGEGDRACVEVTIDGAAPSIIAFQRMSEAETALFAA